MFYLQSKASKKQQIKKVNINQSQYAHILFLGILYSFHVKFCVLFAFYKDQKRGREKNEIGKRKYKTVFPFEEISKIISNLYKILLHYLDHLLRVVLGFLILYPNILEF